MISFTKSPVTEICGDLSFAHYAARPGISQSWLKIFDAESGGAPAKAKFYAEHPEQIPAPSEAMEEGSAYHAFLLQPDQFDNLYSVCTASLEAELYGEAIAGRSKAKSFSRALSTYKAWETAQVAEGRIVISQERANQLHAMREALLNNPDIAPHFDGANLEISMFGAWENGKDALQLKGRADLLNKKTGTILDLKSCRTAHPREFASQVARLGYDLQAAAYTDLCLMNRIKVERFGFLAQDKEPPYLSCIHWMPNEWLKYGRIRYRKILFDVADCIRRDEWAGYESGQLLPPAWLIGEVEALAA